MNIIQFFCNHCWWNVCSEWNEEEPTFGFCRNCRKGTLYGKNNSSSSIPPMEIWQKIKTKFKTYKGG